MVNPVQAQAAQAAQKTTVLQDLAKKQVEKTGIQGWNPLEKATQMVSTISGKIKSLAAKFRPTATTATEPAKPAPRAMPTSLSDRTLSALSPDLRTSLDTLMKTELNPKDPISAAFMGRIEQMISDTGFDQGFITSTISDLVKGDAGMLVRTQTHMADVSEAKVTHSSQFDTLVLRLSLRGVGPEAEKDQVKLTHTLRIAKRALGDVLGPSLGLKSVNAFEFDSKTINALFSQAKFDPKLGNIILGKVILLEHQLKPSGSVADKLTRAGITLKEDQINQYFGQGMRNTADLDFALNTITKFAQKLSQHGNAATLMNSVSTAKYSRLSEQYSQRLMSKTMGVSGASGPQATALLKNLGSKITLTAQDNGVLNTLNSAQSQLAQLRLTQDAIHDPKMQAKTQEKMDGLEVQGGKAISKQGFNTHPLTGAVRLAILQVMSELPEDGASLSALQSGKQYTAILTRLDAMGISSDTLKGLSADSPRPLEGLIMRESRQFEGQASVGKWQSDIHLDSHQEAVIQAKTSMDAHPDFLAVTGQEPKTVTQAQEWTGALKPGGSFGIKMGQMIKISSSDELAMAQATIFGSASLTANAQVDKANTVLVQNESVGDVSRFSMTLSKELGASLGIDLGFLAGLLSVQADAGGKTQGGIKLVFPSQEAASLAIGAMMGNHVDPSILGSVSAVLPVGGKFVNVNAGITAGFSLSDYLGSTVALVENAVGFEGDFGNFSANLSTGAHHQVTHQENLFEKTMVHETGYHIGGSLDVSGFTREVQMEASTASSSHFVHDTLTQADITSSIKITTSGNIGEARQLASEKAFDLISPNSLKTLEKTNPKEFEQLKTLLSGMTDADQLEIHYSLPTDLVVKVNEFSDPASAHFNPKAAKALVADRSSYQLSAVRSVRSQEAQHERSTGIGTLVSSTSYQQASTTQIAAEVRF